MNKLSLFLTVCSLIIFGLVSYVNSADNNVQLSKQTLNPLLGITGVADEDSEHFEPNAAEGGALGMERYFSTRMYAEIKPCGDQVHVAFMTWIKGNNLLATENTKAPNRILIRVWDKPRKGLFEAVYFSSQDYSHARVSLDYYNLKGHKLSPEVIAPLISEYGLSKLTSDLEVAMGCN